jgi:hypothetical protein
LLPHSPPPPPPSSPPLPFSSSLKNTFIDSLNSPGDRRLIISGGSGAWSIEIGYRGVLVFLKGDKKVQYVITNSGLKVKGEEGGRKGKDYPELKEIVGGEEDLLKVLMGKNSKVRYLGYQLLKEILVDFGKDDDKGGIEEFIMNKVKTFDLKGVTVVKNSNLFQAVFPGKFVTLLRDGVGVYEEDGDYFKVAGEVFNDIEKVKDRERLESSKIQVREHASFVM